VTGARAWFVSVALVSCASSSSAPKPATPHDELESAGTATQAVGVQPARPPTEAREARLIDHMLRQVEAARGLKAERAVPGLFLSRPQLIARVKEHVSRELPAEAIRNEGLALQLFGFIPTKFDYEAAEYELLEDQLAGYYEPFDATMYMARDLEDEEANATLAHELVHALQDQRWDLETRSKYEPGAGDRGAAVSALAEGDATSAMFDVMILRAAPGSGKTAADLPDEAFVTQIRDGINRGAAATVPHVMRTSLAAPYIYGTLFVNALRRSGGWEAVDEAWNNSPTTTEQIIHVAKWRAHEPAMSVSAPSFATLGPGWKVADEDSEGELGARIAFEEWLDPAAAAAASDGWGGDRGVLVTDGPRSAFAWRLRYDPGSTKADRAAQPFATIATALEKAFGVADMKKPGFVCRERADRGPIAMLHAGSDIIFTLGPANTADSGWVTGGTCALASHWAREIAAMR
jgi:hypothetical protein